ETLASMLSFLGYETRRAHDGMQALKACDEFHPEVALLDIGMPKVSGYDVARYLRSRPWGSGVLLVAITGWGQAEDRERAVEAGFDHHLVKPVDPDALASLLASEAAR
ncbi:MAG TPA: response regulator, partial [Candidatus Bathyarchaeia archaeon]|nr:response regulator [Candidatus Bathyarchaeia archaeon]